MKQYQKHGKAMKRGHRQVQRSQQVQQRETSKSKEIKGQQEEFQRKYPEVRAVRHWPVMQRNEIKTKTIK